MTRKVNLDDLKPGMKLADDAVLLSGRVLLRSGNELTAKHIRMFKTWGLTEACIENTDLDTGDDQHGHEVSEDLCRQAEMKVADLFRFTDLDFPPVNELYRICVREEVKKLTGAHHD